MKVFLLVLAVSLGAFAQEHKVGVNKYVVPSSTPIARQAHVQTDIVANLAVGADGNVKEVTIVKGHRFLDDATKNALQQWRFICLDCRPGEEFRHQFTISWRTMDVSDCDMPGFKRTTLVFPDRIIIEEARVCILPAIDSSALRKPKRSLFQRRVTIPVAQ